MRRRPLTTVERLEAARTACAEAGIDISLVNQLAVDIEGARKMLGDVSRSTVKRLIERGETRPFKIGSSTRIEITEILEFIDRNRIDRRGPNRGGLTDQACALLDGDHA